jgi:hypothetical protein
MLGHSLIESKETSAILGLPDDLEEENTGGSTSDPHAIHMEIDAAIVTGEVSADLHNDVPPFASSQAEPSNSTSAPATTLEPQVSNPQAITINTIEDNLVKTNLIPTSVLPDGTIIYQPVLEEAEMVQEAGADKIEEAGDTNISIKESTHPLPQETAPTSSDPLKEVQPPDVMQINNNDLGDLKILQDIKKALQSQMPQMDNSKTVSTPSKDTDKPKKHRIIETTPSNPTSQEIIPDIKFAAPITQICALEYNILPKVGSLYMVDNNHNLVKVDLGCGQVYQTDNQGILHKIGLNLQNTS